MRGRYPPNRLCNFKPFGNVEGELGPVPVVYERVHVPAKNEMLKHSTEEICIDLSREYYYYCC